MHANLSISLSLSTNLKNGINVRGLKIAPTLDETALHGIVMMLFGPSIRLRSKNTFNDAKNNKNKHCKGIMMDM